MRKYKVHMLLYVAFLAVWVLMTRGAVSPLIYPDEAGYIGWAREFSGTAAEHWRYLPGYGLLLAPIFCLTEELLKAYPMIVLLNCLMGAAIPVLLYSMAGRFTEGKGRLLFAVAVGLYPAWMLYGNLALSEVFLTFLYTLLLWSVCQWEKHPCFGLLSLFCCVWMMVSHGRCGVAVLGVLAAFCSFVWNKPWRKKALLAGSGILIVIAVISISYLTNTQSVNGSHLREQLLGLFSLDGLWNSFSTLFSQSYYLMLSTFGLVALGVWQGIGLLKKKNQPEVWFLLITFLFSLLLSAVFMNHHEKPDHILYGRYNEFVLGGPLLLGLIALLKQQKRSWIVWVLLGLALFTGLRYGKNLNGIDSNLCHTWGLYFYKLMFSRFTFVGVTVWFAFWTGLLLWSSKKHPIGAILFLCGLFLVTSVYTKYDYFIKGAAPRYQPSQIADLIDEDVAMEPLKGDTMGYPWGVYHLLTMHPEIAMDDSAPLLLTSEKRGRIVASETFDTLYLCDIRESEQPYSGEIELKDWNDRGLTLFVKNTGRSWICYQGAQELEDCVRLVGWIVSEDKEEQFRVDFPKNVYEGNSLTIDVPLSLEDGTYQIQISPSVDLSQVIASVCVFVTVKDGAVVGCETISGEWGRFDLLEGEGYPRQTRGLFRGRSTGVTVYENLGWNIDAPCLIVETDGEEGDFSVTVNDKTLSVKEVFETCVSFDLAGIKEIDKIEIESKVIAPAKQAGIPELFGFLRADSPCKPISLFVRGVDKLFDLLLDFCPYGVRITHIRVGEGL